MLMRINLRIVYVMGLILAAALCAMPRVIAQSNDGEDLMQRSLKAYYYAGNTFSGVAVMRLVSGSSERKQEMKFLRKTVNAKGDQKYYLYFRQPIDVKGT